jgi:hypothetical protein
MLTGENKPLHSKLLAGVDERYGDYQQLLSGRLPNFVTSYQLGCCERCRRRNLFSNAQPGPAMGSAFSWTQRPTGVSPQGPEQYRPAKTLIFQHN